jgi:hypothetical protein
MLNAILGTLILVFLAVLVWAEFQLVRLRIRGWLRGMQRGHVNDTLDHMYANTRNAKQATKRGG